jgi:hypothetical protein
MYIKGLEILSVVIGQSQKLGAGLKALHLIGP